MTDVGTRCVTTQSNVESCGPVGGTDEGCAGWLRTGHSRRRGISPNETLISCRRVDDVRGKASIVDRPSCGAHTSGSYSMAPNMMAIPEEYSAAIAYPTVAIQLRVVIHPGWARLGH